MSSASRRSRSRGSRWGRRLAVLGGLVVAVGTVRRVVLDRDQRAFEQRYGPLAADRRGP